MSYKQQAEDYYNEHYKGRGLAPKHVVALKEALTKAYRKGERPKVVAERFLKTVGGDKPKKPAKEPEKKAKAKAAEPESKPKKTKREKNEVVPLPPSEVLKMDRKSLKAVATQLRGMGVTLDTKKSDDDATYMRKINEAMNKLPSPEMLTTLERIDPDKLETVLKTDCFGIYIDLRTASCQACPDRDTCLKAYMENLKGNFSLFKDAMVEIKTEEAAEKVDDDAAKAAKTSAEASKPKAKKGKVAPIVFDKKRRIFILDVENPNEEGDDLHDCIAEILTEAPGTMKELRTIVENHFEYEKGDAGTQKFVNDWIIGLRDSGVLKLDTDLDDEERATLKAAGIEI